MQLRTMEYHTIPCKTLCIYRLASGISEPREINNDVEGSDFDIVSLSFIRHGLMFANTNVGSRMLYNIHVV